MNRETGLELKRQIDAALESDSKEAYADLARSLSEALRLENEGGAGSSAAEDDPGDVLLQAIEAAWFSGSPAQALSPRSRRERVVQLISDMSAVQEFALAISRGNLSLPLKVKGPIAGGLKTLQSNLRHLTL